MEKYDWAKHFAAQGRMDGGKVTRRWYIGEKGKTPVADWNAPVASYSHEERLAGIEFYMAKKVGESLASHYPNRHWSVDVDVRNQIIVIQNPHLSKAMGYHLHIRSGDTLALILPRAIRAGGEILERYGVTRDRVIDPMLVEEGLPRNWRDDVISKDAVPNSAAIKVHA